MNMPPVVTESEWLEKRVELLKKEKEITRATDRLNAERRRLPMVKVEKNYVFDSPEGKKSLLDLFEGRRQLVIYHFMYGPDWKEGCPGCTGFINEIGNLDLLPKRNTTFAMVARAPVPTLQAWAQKHGWPWTWVSSGENDFNYDYHVSFRAGEPATYNYAPRGREDEGEGPGISVFFRDDENNVYHTYSNFARGGEHATDSYSLLDLTPYGRQEDFEDSPEGWPQKPTYG